MGKEIERKYLVSTDGYKGMAEDKVNIKQGYLCRKPERTVRVRIWGERGFLTIKGITKGFHREEYEYGIPLSDAEALMKLCEGPILEKTRWMVPYGARMWEVDEFAGTREGLVLAEIELGDESDTYDLPPFIGREVTGDPAYYNSNL